MDSIVQSSAYFGFFTTLYLDTGYPHKNAKRMRSTLCNPLLLTIIFIIAFLKLADISYASYAVMETKSINYFLTPSTVCLAVPLYRQLKLLKEYARSNPYQHYVRNGSMCYYDFWSGKIIFCWRIVSMHPLCRSPLLQPLPLA